MPDLSDMETYKWHEDPARKNLFDAEMGVLRRGLSGDFEFVEEADPKSQGGRIEVFGWLKFDVSQKQAIRISFPTKYPYSLPAITMLKGEHPVENIKALPPELFGKGNQYADGGACLLRKNQWQKNEHNIGWLLRRAQRWLTSAHSKEGFKPEEIVEEAPALMPHAGQVLIPHDIQLPENANTGTFYLTQFKRNHYILEHNILGNQTFPLNISNEAFKWYRMDHGVTLRDALEPFNKSISEWVVNTVQQKFAENFNEANKNIAFYFPDDPQQWHFFKLAYQVVGNGLNVAVPVYLISRNIDRELYLRTKDIFDSDLLKKKKVTIIGLGALGSEVARSLGRNAIGHFNLIDNDTFEIGNSVRHAANLFSIGDPKVTVVKQLLLQTNPNITVNSYHVDVLNDDGILEQAFAASNLIIVLTAEDAVDYLLNDIYHRRFQVPFIFGRVSAGALTGAIQVVNIDDSACLRCLSMYGADTLPAPKAEGVAFDELKPEYGSCSTPPLPGSEIDTKEVALQITRISLQILLRDHPTPYPRKTGNQFYWHGPFGSMNEPPFSWEFKNLTKHPDCEVCNEKNSL